METKNFKRVELKNEIIQSVMENDKKEDLIKELLAKKLNGGAKGDICGPGLCKDTPCIPTLCDPGKCTCEFGDIE